MKLAQFDSLVAAKPRKPLLLLDDIFDKLDDRRIQRLIEMMAQDHFGQVFITDARPERTRNLLKSLQNHINTFRSSEWLGRWSTKKEASEFSSATRFN